MPNFRDLQKQQRQNNIKYGIPLNGLGQVQESGETGVNGAGETGVNGEGETGVDGADGAGEREEPANGLGEVEHQTANAGLENNFSAINKLIQNNLEFLDNMFKQNLLDSLTIKQVYDILLSLPKDEVPTIPTSMV